MAAVSLTTLRARARERADMPVAGFVADSATSLDAWINEGVQKLQELLVKAYGEQFVEASTTFATVAGTTGYNLPTDMLAFYGISLNIGGVEVQLRPFNRAERALHKNVSTFGSWQFRPYYRLKGMATGQIELMPAPDGAYTATVLYAPSATLLVNAGDTVNFPNGWERYVVGYAATQMKMKEESDTRDLRIELDKMEKELEEVAQRRNADQPHSVVDVESVEMDSPLNYF